MKTYLGVRDLDNDRCDVTVDGQPLEMRLDLRSLSPDGFEWGYRGAGTAQLALALLADAAGDEAALANYQHFKIRAIAPLGGEWRFTDAMILDWLEHHGHRSRAVAGVGDGPPAA